MIHHRKNRLIEFHLMDQKILYSLLEMEMKVTRILQACKKKNENPLFFSF